ncbi:hypothetical protein [Clostridium cuniculi]|uniref:hypothetical protein n=1 Tax=Clostridium cuniculi TaxID=2548455 RepID=UPI0010552CE7|nr:hypothetical protein [Clostridium cuniculi]
MKKTTSFHLEEDILEEIENYKKKYKLSSRNVALERMLLERRTLMILPGIAVNNTNTDNIINEVKVNNEEDTLSKSMKDTFGKMPN